MTKLKERPLGLVGQGRIYQKVKQYTERVYEEIILFSEESSPQQLASCKIIVSCSDTWSPRTLQLINRRCRQANVALLSVYTQFDEAVIGPWVNPQTQGCTTCAELRKLGATSSQTDYELLQRYLSQEHTPVVSQTWLSSFSLETLAALVGEEIATYLQKPDQLRTHGALLFVSLETLECRRHAFLPSPACPDCQQLVEDRAELAMVTLQDSPKQGAFTYRISQPVANAEHLLASYVDQRTGLASALTVENTNLLPIASSRLSVELERTTVGSGSTLRPAQSKLVSVLESVERYAGLYPRGKRTMVRASYHQLMQQKEQALDPTTLGLHSPEEYEWSAQHAHHPGSRHPVPYHHDLMCHWVWGYSFQKQAPILVPEHCVYYGVPTSEENPLFLAETSNGCALGNSLEEAIFHGMLEVAERDAFLLTWYAQLKLPHLAPSSVTDPTIRLLIEHLEYHSGYTIHILNASLDHAIPCLCLLCVDEQGRENTPKAFVTTGSHPHPEQALLRALRESALFLTFRHSLDQDDRAQALKMLADGNLVQEIDHHPLVYSLPEAFERLHFLYHVQTKQIFQEAFGDFYRHPPECMDLRTDLEALINTYLMRGIDVIVIDQTAPEYQPCGLRAVKVLMPGMLPMTFGQRNRRITGFERLHQLPFVLGYQDHPLTKAEINPYPHPFL
ncbi:SagD family biosynthesis docking scaffold protein [Dictyobacter sp. S3.2.2.5]|uniref:SagD family biosynthesis docking scaffold protein n=1 Tax=Dictyobacter halimunensis TaxID=3026934 RepID=A0ABQ6FMU1_9CHLR|nr:SagD family biosynthesis docking scaffold protein [Dictyobacter sp. S3.2.2.5]